MAILWCLGGFAQGISELHGFTAGGGTQSGVDFALGQTFTFQSPEVSEGILQGYFMEERDTLLLLSNEMRSYTPGNNDIDTVSAEGYDALLHRQVYQMTCANGFEGEATSSGTPTQSVTLTEPSVLPAGSIAPAGPVSLSLNRPNPDLYPVGDTTLVTWTAAVAGQSKQCQPSVIVHYYNCEAHHSPVIDVDSYSYPAVRLGYYCWTGKNMRATHYADGTDIPDVMTYPAEFAVGVSDIPATFGHLYTWPAATGYNETASRKQGICPNGWHIPTPQETDAILTDFTPIQLMSNDPQVPWLPQNGNNESHFFFLPAGYYNASYNSYEALYTNGYYWTIEEVGTTIAHACFFGAECSTIEFIPGNKHNAYSVRCVLDY